MKLFIFLFIQCFITLSLSFDIRFELWNTDTDKFVQVVNEADEIEVVDFNIAFTIVANETIQSLSESCYIKVLEPGSDFATQRTEYHLPWTSRGDSRDPLDLWGSRAIVGEYAIEVIPSANMSCCAYWRRFKFISKKTSSRMPYSTTKPIICPETNSCEECTAVIGCKYCLNQLSVNGGPVGFCKNHLIPCAQGELHAAQECSDWQRQHRSPISKTNIISTTLINMETTTTITDMKKRKEKSSPSLVPLIIAGIALIAVVIVFIVVYLRHRSMQTVTIA
mmetsp:Transcript_21799/g.37148  ORF Transcript_21799/g.37148 Transcript_21799/m.37148 type:complete len:279 (+) Transcript_21799:31-867(+)